MNVYMSVGEDAINHMNLIITNKYMAYTDARLLGYQGETNARTIKVAQPHIDEATAYRLIFDCGNDVIYEVDVTDGEYIVDGGLLINVGTVKCQWQAVKLVGDTYELVAKSNIIEFEVKPSIQGDVAPIPTYEQSKSALDEVLQAAEQAQGAEAAAERAEIAAATATEAAEVAEQAKDETITAAETAIQKAAEAEQSAALAAESATAAGQAKTAAETAASNANQSAETASANAVEATQAAEAAEKSSQEATEKAAEISASAEQISKNTSDIADLSESVANPSIYALDLVQQTWGTENLWNQGRIEKEYNGKSTWQYALKEIPIEPGKYTVYVGVNGSIEKTSYRRVDFGYDVIHPFATGGKYTNFNSLQKIIVDGESQYFTGKLVVKFQISTASFFPEAGVYYIDNILIFKGDVTSKPGIPVDFIDGKEFLTVPLNKVFKKSERREVFSSGETITLAEIPNCKQNNVLSFCGNIIGDFTGKIGISHGKTTYRCGFIAIDNINLYVYKDKTTVRNTFAHGLSINNFMSIVVNVGYNSVTKVNISTIGGKFEKEITWNGCINDVIFENSDVAMKNVEATFVLNDLDRDLWCFGDSYFDYWAKKMYDLGFGNFYSDAFSGRASAAAMTSLKYCLGYKTPKKIYWCLGMNDKDSGAINSNWLTAVEELKQICSEKSIELVFATIPNTPTNDNSYKNQYIYDSGYEYVDINKLVGADENVNWYDGLLSTDNVHPTSDGIDVIVGATISHFPEMKNQ